MAQFMSTYNEQISKLAEELKNASTPAEVLNLSKKQIVLMTELTTGGVKSYEEIKKDLKQEIGSSLTDQCLSPAPAVASTDNTLKWVLLLLLIAGGLIITFLVIYRFGFRWR